MIGRDGLAGLAAAAASLVLFWMTLGLERNPLVPIGPGFYPRIVLGITVLLGAALFVHDLLRRRGAAPPAARPAAALNYRLVALTFGAFAVYAVLLPLLGYRLATFVFVLGTSFLLEPPRRPGLWARGLVLAAITALATYYVFDEYLAVLLPRGSWTGF
ncbi:MAG TPA: tripartite tricarboxylate transporter TctB family protein [Burkholderiales bacterium]|nr:tripartite tricarboxylate transporter TctB family protein [Burkholderiales bacterium]